MTDSATTTSEAAGTAGQALYRRFRAQTFSQIVGQDAVVQFVTDALGDYTIYLAPDTYNVVAAMEGYAIDCKVVAATPGYFDYSDNNFTLTTQLLQNLFKNKTSSNIQS